MRLGELRKQLFEDIEFRRAHAAEDLIHRVALRVFQLRHERNMTQKELAQEIGMKQPRIAEIEGGFANITLKTLAHLAFALGYRVEDLVCRHMPRVSLEDIKNEAPSDSVKAVARVEENLIYWPMLQVA